MAYKIGINAGAGFTHPVENIIPVIKQVGFDAFFTNWERGCRSEAWAEAGAKSGLIYQSIHAPFGKVQEIWKGSEEGKEMVQILKECIADCHRFDVPLMIIHPYKGFGEHTPTDIGLKLYGDVIEEAEKHGVLLGFENVEGEEFLAAIMEEYRKSSVVRFCWDTGHEICYNAGKDQLALYGDRLAGTHFDDNLGAFPKEDINLTWHDDLHQLPFDGIVDWQGVMDRIKKVNYEGILTFELTIRNKPGKHTHDEYAKMTCEEFYAEACKRAKRIAAM